MNPVGISLNHISKNKYKNESQFRVHCFLMGVYIKNQNINNFISSIFHQLSKQINVHIVQISNIIDDNHVDLSIGFSNDLQAVQFLTYANNKLILPNQTGNMTDFKPNISRTFQSFINGNTNLMKSQYLLTYSKQSNNSGTKQKQSTYKSKQFEQLKDNMKKYQKNNYQEQLYQHKRSRDKKKSKNSKHSSTFNQLWIFAIPLQFQQEIIFDYLLQKNIRCLKTQWKMIQDMQYLEIEIEEPISLNKLKNLSIKIQNYPIMIIPKLKHQSTLQQQISHNQIEITFKTPINQKRLLFYCEKCGGVIAMIKDQSSCSSNRFIIALSNYHKVQKISSLLLKKFNQCIIVRPSYPLRIGRIQKMFTFQSILDSL